MGQILYIYKKWGRYCTDIQKWGRNIYLQIPPAGKPCWDKLKPIHHSPNPQPRSANQGYKILEMSLERFGGIRAATAQCRWHRRLWLELSSALGGGGGVWAEEGHFKPMPGCNSATNLAFWRGLRGEVKVPWWQTERRVYLGKRMGRDGSITALAHSEIPKGHLIY